ncbi:hypothetical protein [Microcoleus sp. bin38.metabat.b11b12b14.051]|nr:hypothetical protein [Microcoleus sp. bin38.metabat.b11b12b14.051]
MPDFPADFFLPETAVADESFYPNSDLGDRTTEGRLISGSRSFVNS